MSYRPRRRARRWPPRTRVTFGLYEHIRGASGRLTPREHMFVSAFSFTLTEHDPEWPWLVLGRERRKITLDDGLDFFEWARDA